MVKPASFGFNSETALSNSFQYPSSSTNDSEKAVAEFELFVEKLRNQGVSVVVVDDTNWPQKPDAIFPNNWFSVHESGEIFLYPMLTSNRRQEVRTDIFQDFMNSKYEIVDLRRDYSEILEGTGSMVLDRVNKIAYACISERTNENLFLKWCARMNFSPIVFHATNKDGRSIYHTNVIITVATDFVLICLESISTISERNNVIQSITNSGKVLIDLSMDQMQKFCGNALEVIGSEEQKYLVCSKTAFSNYTQNQIATIEAYSKILYVEIPTIEQIGGGSARCMLAELF
jgi:hypothetical protein